MITLISTFLSTLALAFRRLWSQKALMLCLLVGMAAAVGLLSSIPLYADAVHHELLQGELTEAGTHRPPFAFLWRYIGAWHGDVSWDDYRPVDAYLSQQGPGAVDLPLAALVRHVQTGNLRLFPAAGSGDFVRARPAVVDQPGLCFRPGGAGRTWLAALSHEPGPGSVEVLASRALAEQMGLQLGEGYVLLASDEDGRQIPVRISGIWQPRDPKAPFWFYQPSSFDEVLLTSADAFEAQVVPLVEEPVSLAVWYQIFDGSHVRSADVPGLLDRVAAAESRAEALLGHTSLDASPADALGSYESSARLLTVMLTIFAIPVVGLILYFVALIAGMVVGRSQGEIAILRSRGTTRLQVLLVFLLEGVIVGGLGLALGLVLGHWLAEMMGRTRTFLDPALLSFGSLPDLQSLITPAALAYGLLAVGLGILALLVPALAASRHTIITFKWERARTLVRPLWQRAYLDLLLLIPVLYGLYLLLSPAGDLLGSQLSSIRILQAPAPSDPFSNPLLLLIPALFCFALSLLFVRFFPWLMRALAWLAGWLPGTTLLLILRQLSRSSGQYTGPLLLLSLTLSLAIFTASMATTLDGHLEDRVYYQVGADLNLAESGESTEEAEGPSLLLQPTPAPSTDRDQGPRWLFLPVSAHLQVPGVRAAARVGDYGATSNIGGRQQSGRLLGVDRIEFPAVAYYRPDFGGGEPLAGQMNRLAPAASNLLVSRGFLAQHRLAVGDPLRLTVSIAGEVQAIDFVVAGPLDLFPTLYPQDGPFFVANLDYVFERLGGTFPYDVWLATEPDVAGEEVVAGVRGLGVAVAAASDARAAIAEQQTRPERQGLFGLLSVGFLAAAGLTVLGFLLYAVVSFRRRFIELGMLRAVGLSAGQMGAYLAGEQALLILIGGALGTALGLWASSLFIPYQQLGLDKTAQVPPFVVQIAWGDLWTIYALFGAMLVLAVLVLIVLLLRMRIFEAVKMGEAG